MPNGNYDFRLAGALGKTGASSGVLGAAWYVSNFAVGWLRKINPEWMWPEDADKVAVNVMIIIAFGITHLWVDWRRGHGKPVVPLTDSRIK